MKNYKPTNKRGFFIFLIICGVFYASLNACISPKKFDASYLFKNSFYANALSNPDSDITPFYVGFNQNYVVNNNIFVGAMTKPSYRFSQIGTATAEVEKYSINIPPKDSEEMYILRLNKNFKSKKGEENNMFDTVGTYYVFVSLKYSEFKDNKKSPRKYAVSGYGHVYVGHEDMRTGNLLFLQELKIKNFKNKQPKSLECKRNIWGQRTNVLLLFESRLNKNKNKEAISELSMKDTSDIVHLYEVPKDSTLNFSYIS